ncbi:hypothetical protein KCV07_g4845, partial [Aureobasidium melanogenum]
MCFFYLLNVVVLFFFSNVVSSSPVAQGTTSECNARDIAIVKRTANEPVYFCSWWNSDTRTRTPFMELTVSQVTNACKCISKSSKNKRAATVDQPVLSKGQSVESCSVVMSKQFTEPWHFCKFYTAYPRTTSPFRKYSAKSLLVLCDCVEEKSISSTTKKSSTKKNSVTKTTIKSSFAKSASSKKPTSTIKISSTSVSSAIATKTPTARTDGLFYLRVASTAAPPNNYYITLGDGYSFGSSRELIFGIGSNGYLYQLVGSDQYWMGTSLRAGGYGYLGQYSEPGQYSSSNFKCSYDESYLLSCAVTSLNGTLTPVIWSYREFSGEYFEWMVLSEPNDQPVIDLYVETAAPAISSTTSTSSSPSSSITSSTAAATLSSTAPFNLSSTASFTSRFNATSSSTSIFNATSSLTISSVALSTASSNASSNASATASSTILPTCTLVPRLPNGDFEDGKNQTAWLTTAGYTSSWAPTRTNPYGGSFSGQLTIEQTKDYARASVYLVNTMSNLCPGFNYSISYYSFCHVPSTEYCYVSITTSEAIDDEKGSFITTNPNTGWLAEDDAFSFTAASSTSTLYLYVGTVADTQSVGNIYVDNFSIALSGSKDIQEIA